MTHSPFSYSGARRVLIPIPVGQLNLNACLIILTRSLPQTSVNEISNVRNPTQAPATNLAGRGRAAQQLAA